MVNETQIQALTGFVEAILSPTPEFFLVEIKIKPTNNIKVVLDGDKGVPISKCVDVNRALYKQIEETGVFPADDFALEVSSPGIDEPLKLYRQYVKNTGRFAAITLNDATVAEGKIVAVNEDGLVLEETKGKGKKKETVQNTYLFDSIKSTKIQIKF
ncbi:MAG: ribosome maturation factor [Flavihumibacter sp.]|nr:ribosome maturation factor [Flavihumibacter sp.]